MFNHSQGSFSNFESENQKNYEVSTGSSSGTSFPVLAISILGIIATAFLLLSYYVFVMKCCLDRQRRSNFWARFFNSQDRRHENPFFFYETTFPNRGLDASLIQTIPIFQFKKWEDNEKCFNECSVCLNEFQEDERLKLLPLCNHVFHIDCIDIWLQNNKNCPLCRSMISNQDRVSESESRFHLHAQNPQQSNSMVVIDDNDIVLELGDRDFNQSSRSLMDSTALQVNTTPYVNPSPIKIERRMMFKEHRKIQSVSSMGDECIDIRGKDQHFPIQPIRRSFSMDFSIDRHLYLSVQDIFQLNSHIHGGNTSENCSRRTRNYFLSFGHVRGSRNSVLPVNTEK